MKKVALYIRVSTEEQVTKWHWIEIQREALMAYTKSQWYELNTSHIFIDEWKSWAQKEDRPALYNLFQCAKNKEFNIVLVWKVDRFFRNSAYLLEWIEALSKMWVWFIATTQNINTTDVTWKLTLTILGWIAEMERENIKERTHSGILASMRKWKWARWGIPYWYKKDTDWFLKVDKKESNNVKMVFDMLNKDWLNTYQIAEKFNSMNIETAWSKWKLGSKRKENIKHENFWHRSMIHKILTNELYTWLLIQNRFTKDKLTNKRVEKDKSEWIIWKSPKIITKQAFNKAKISLEKNLKFSKKNTTKWEVYMLSRLIKCGITWYKFIWYKNWKGLKNYKLSVNKTKVKDFKSIWVKWISALKIETVVWYKLKYVLQNPNILTKELQLISNTSDNQEKEIREKIILMNENILKINENTEWLLNLVSWLDNESIQMIQKKIITNNSLKKEIREEKELLMKELESNTSINDKVSNFKEISNLVNNNLDNLSYETKAELCKLLINEVVFDWVNVQINLIVPISPKNKALLSTDTVKDFFNENKDFMTTKVNDIKKNIIKWICVVSNLRTYYHQI